MPIRSMLPDPQGFRNTLGGRGSHLQDRTGKGVPLRSPSPLVPVPTLKPPRSGPASGAGADDMVLGDTPYIDLTDLDRVHDAYRRFFSIPPRAKPEIDPSTEALRTVTILVGTIQMAPCLAGHSRTGFVHYRPNATFGQNNRGIYTKFPLAPSKSSCSTPAGLHQPSGPTPRNPSGQGTVGVAQTGAAGLGCSLNSDLRHDLGRQEKRGIRRLGHLHA